MRLGQSHAFFDWPSVKQGGVEPIYARRPTGLLISANLPDLDIVSALGGSAQYLHWHRNLTHSFLAAPLLAFAVTAVFKWLRPALPLFPTALVAFAGVFSHLLLDLTNIYGIRLLLPFRETWFHWDLTPVIDPWILAAYALALAGPWFANLVSTEIGERRRGAGRGFAVAALLFFLAYTGGRAAIHRRVVRSLEAREYAGVPPARVAAFPVSVNPFHWQGIAETSSAYWLYDLRLPLNFDPSIPDSVVEKVAPSPAIDAAARTQVFRAMLEFALYPVYRVLPLSASLQRIELSDLRFPFASTAVVSANLGIESSSFRFRPEQSGR